MSTTHRAMSDEEIAGMVEDLKKWPSVGHDNGDYELAVMPFITFYFTYDPARSLETSLAMIKIHEDFEKLLGQPYKVQTHPDSERPHPYGSKRLGDLREWARKTRADKSFVFNVTDEKNHRSSPTNAGYFWRTAHRSWSSGNYSSIQFYYRWQWWLDHQSYWRSFVHRTIERLQPEQVYSGFSMANPLEFGTRSEATVWDRALTPHFYGLDTDYPFGMSHSPELPWGLRPPTWGFLLSDIWRQKLAIERPAVRAALDNPRIRIDELNCGQWIELGPQPELYPVEEGIPELPVLLNRLLRPLRHTRLDLLGFGEWEGDPNERFSMFDSRRWLARFDENSDWPDPEARGLSPDVPHMPPPIEHARDGEPCPRTGWWLSSATPGQRHYLEEGDLMPLMEDESNVNLTLWNWSPRQ